MQIYIYIYVAYILRRCKYMYMYMYIFWPCHTACGILVLQPGIEPGLTTLKLRVLTTEDHQKPPFQILRSMSKEWMLSSISVYI